MQYDVVCVGFVNQDIVLKGIDKGALERDSTHAESTLTAVGETRPTRRWFCRNWVTGWR